MPPSLSVCCVSAATSPTGPRLLALLRPVADEIVVAVDDRGDPDVIAAVAAVADDVIAYPYADPVNRSRAWAHAQCHGDWVLVVDDDEVPSAALVEALPDLVGARDVTHFWLPCRWLYPDAGRYLAEPPWAPDYQLRLMVNDERLVRFPGVDHWTFAPTGPGRYLDLALYHANLVLLSRAEREARAAKQAAQSPEKRVTGGEINAVYYLPERRKGARTERVPADDRRLVDAVLRSGGAGESREPPREPAAVRRVTREEIDRLWTARPLDDADYEIALRTADEPFPMSAGEQRTFDVLVENAGGARFDWGPDAQPPVFASYHWRTPSGEVVEYDGIRTPLPASLPPGASQVVPVHVLAPAEPGTYELELDLVHEGVRWFERGPRITVEVVATDEEIEAWSRRRSSRLATLAERVLGRRSSSA